MVRHEPVHSNIKKSLYKFNCSNQNVSWILDPQNVVEGDIISEDVFACISRNRVYYRIVLTTTHLILQDVDDDSLLERFDIEDMFGCSTMCHRKEIENSSAYIYFYFYPKSRRKNVISNIRFRQKLTLIFEVEKVGNSYEQNVEIANSWRYEVLNILGTKHSGWQVSKLSSSSQNINDHLDDTSRLALTRHLYLRKFLIVLNPKSGQGKSIDIFQVQKWFSYCNEVL